MFVNKTNAEFSFYLMICTERIQYLENEEVRNLFFQKLQTEQIHFHI